MLTKKQEKHREQLRLKMCEHQDIATKYRKQIDAIDESQKQTERDKIIGRCFALKSEHGKVGDMGYLRVEYFGKDFTPYGTEIQIRKYVGKKYITLELNKYGHMDWITNGKQIPHSRFNAMLRQAKKMIKLKK